LTKRIGVTRRKGAEMPWQAGGLVSSHAID